MAKKLSAAGARARLEMLAPDAAETLGEIIASFRGELFHPDEEKRPQKIADKVKLARELRQVSAQILDRGGAPPLKQIQMQSQVEHLHRQTEQELLGAIAEKFLRLDPEDRSMLLQMVPHLRGALPEIPDEPPQE